jgi:hypothetical protein
MAGNQGWYSRNLAKNPYTAEEVMISKLKKFIGTLKDEYVYKETIKNKYKEINNFFDTTNKKTKYLKNWYGFKPISYFPRITKKESEESYFRAIKKRIINEAFGFLPIVQDTIEFYNAKFIISIPATLNKFVKYELGYNFNRDDMRSIIAKYNAKDIEDILFKWALDDNNEFIDDNTFVSALRDKFKEKYNIMLEYKKNPGSSKPLGRELYKESLEYEKKQENYIEAFERGEKNERPKVAPKQENYIEAFERGEKNERPKVAPNNTPLNQRNIKIFVGDEKNEPAKEPVEGGRRRATKKAHKNRRRYSRRKV